MTPEAWQGFALGALTAAVPTAMALAFWRLYRQLVEKHRDLERRYRARRVGGVGR